MKQRRGSSGDIARKDSRGGNQIDDVVADVASPAKTTLRRMLLKNGLRPASCDSGSGFRRSVLKPDWPKFPRRPRTFNDVLLFLPLRNPGQKLLVESSGNAEATANPGINLR